MRELEFLPTWYHQVRGRKRWVVIESWMLLAVIVSIGSWIGLKQTDIRAAETSLASLKGQVSQTRVEEQMLNQQLSLRQELQEREQLISSLGYPVEMTRLLQTLDALMPKEMTLNTFDCTADQQPTDNKTHLDRTLKVTMTGVAPNDMEVAHFLDGITKVPFFEQANVSYIRDHVDAGHVFREFQMSFQMNLNQPMGN